MVYFAHILKNILINTADVRWCWGLVLDSFFSCHVIVGYFSKLLTFYLFILCWCSICNCYVFWILCSVLLVFETNGISSL